MLRKIQSNHVPHFLLLIEMKRVELVQKAVWQLLKQLIYASHINVHFTFSLIGIYSIEIKIHVHTDMEVIANSFFHLKQKLETTQVCISQ